MHNFLNVTLRWGKFELHHNRDMVLVSVYMRGCYHTVEWQRGEGFSTYALPF